jgi:uncharacterized protein (DUF2267 family)
MEKELAQFQETGMQFLRDLATNLGTPDDTNHANELTASFFAALREVITPAESANLMANLPMYLRALYVSEWKIRSRRPRIKTVEEFFQLMRDRYPQRATRALGDDQSLAQEVHAVIGSLRRYLSDGEVRDIQSQLSPEVAAVWDEPQLAGV